MRRSQHAQLRGSGGGGHLTEKAASIPVDVFHDPTPVHWPRF
jgi:hypothetical protein